MSLRAGGLPLAQNAGKPHRRGFVDLRAENRIHKNSKSGKKVEKGQQSSARKEGTKERLVRWSLSIY